MARFEFKLPDIGEGVTEGEIVSWLVKVGDEVAEDQEMVEVMTDKATVTIGAPKAGRIAALGGDVGDVIPVGRVLVVFELAGDAVAAKPPPEHVPVEPPGPSVSRRSDVAASAVGDIRESLPGTDAGRPVARRPAGPGGGGTAYANERPLAAPATRRLARELGVDVRNIEPSGPAGRVTREDVERYAARAPADGSDATPAASTVAKPRAADAGSAPRPAPARTPIAPVEGDRRVPIRGLRRRIFENMARAKHTAAHFTYVDECDVTELRVLRERTQAAAKARGVRLSYLPFIVKAAVAALHKHPALNCVVDENAHEIVLKSSYDVGIAAATDAGLVVPVLRNADRLSLIDMAREIDRLATDARSGKIRVEDLGGSSFTITSLGRLGGLFATPIVNHPEVAILGVHEMKKRPVVRGDQIAIGYVMLLSLSFDHRIIDGHVGAAFAREIIDYLEAPERMLLEMV